MYLRNYKKKRKEKKKEIEKITFFLKIITGGEMNFTQTRNRVPLN